MYGCFLATPSRFSSGTSIYVVLLGPLLGTRQLVPRPPSPSLPPLSSSPHLLANLLRTLSQKNDLLVWTHCCLLQNGLFQSPEALLGTAGDWPPAHFLFCHCPALCCSDSPESDKSHHWPSLHPPPPYLFLLIHARAFEDTFD